LIKEIQHPENKLRDIEITSDKPGRYQAMGQAHGTYTQPTDPKEIKIENFSKEIAKILEYNNTVHGYEKLILVAPPHINGLLLKHLDKQVKKRVTHHIEKDFIHLSEDKLLDHLNEALEK
ncbi:host attachment protein, partial [Legionella sp.]